MKKIIVFLFLIISSTSYSQIMFGGKLGIATSTLRGFEIDGYMTNSKQRIMGGGVFNYSLGSKFSLQTEVLYHSVSSNLEYNFVAPREKGIIEMDIINHYISAPIILQYKLGSKNQHFHIDAGLMSSMLLKSKYDGKRKVLNVNGEVTDESIYRHEEPEMLNNDLAYFFGIGLFANTISFDFRYIIGMKEVFKESSVYPKLKSKSFQVTVSYLIKN